MYLLIFIESPYSFFFLFPFFFFEFVYQKLEGLEFWSFFLSFIEHFLFLCLGVKSKNYFIKY